MTAQKAAFSPAGPQAPRVIDTAAPVLHPVLTGRLEPDIRLIGFELSIEQAKGRRAAVAGPPALPADPGYFFVLTERPGEPRFGLDPTGPEAPIGSWNDLSWPLLTAPTGSPFVHLAGNAGLTPAGNPAVWGRTAADQASILLQSPVIVARHASEMLP